MDNIENMKDYVSIVTSKNNAKRAFWISMIALFFSLSTLLINYIDKREKIKALLISKEQLNQNNDSITNKTPAANGAVWHNGGSTSAENVVGN